MEIIGMSMSGIDHIVKIGSRTLSNIYKISEGLFGNDDRKDGEEISLVGFYDLIYALTRIDKYLLRNILNNNCPNCDKDVDVPYITINYRKFCSQNCVIKSGEMG